MTMTHTPLYPDPRTIAEAVATEFVDGTSWTCARGTTMDEYIALHDARVEHRSGSGGDEWRVVFTDGSVITACGGAWDVGYTTCWCWAGNGHDNCTAGEG
jgi:hypothetical protein